MAADPLSSIVAALEREQIIPDVLPETLAFTPSVLFSVVYPNGAEVNLGNEMIVADTQDEPELRLAALNGSWDDSASEVSYTLAMLDPDAPSRDEPIYRTFRHWLITGLKSPPVTSNAAHALNALKSHPATTPYRPPGPRPNSGLHRYIFLLFQEPASAEPFVVPQGQPEYGAALEERRSWNPVTFASKYGLKLVGANYFLVRSPEVAVE
ncbi:PEBP-like protein [Trametes versicolor FP-101664 SS1]|uniref:PEBP-like protein n=1 Tax=Trametes versicolor (strain FP-101664) TaxID=717944 RepID=UPI0004621C3E|nr:PEBP-like protein [Trametes versicolor FP-101664 SS1]EIW56216.1 PEBP-like protein [Trametes versicolor FP-101664 SS1]